MAALAVILLPIIVMMGIIFIVFNIVVAALGITTVILGIRAIIKKKVKNGFIACLTLFLTLGLLLAAIWGFFFTPDTYFRFFTNMVIGKELTAIEYLDYEKLEEYLKDGWKPEESEYIFEDILPLEDDKEKDEANLKILDLLLEYGVNPNSPEQVGDKEMSILQYAVGQENVKAVEIILKHGGDPNNTNYPQYKQTAGHNIFFEFGTEHYEMLQILLENGLDVNAKDYYGETVLEHLNEEFLEIDEDTENYQDIKELLDKLKSENV